MSELIFEVGAEELPAGFIVPALESMAAQWKELAAAQRLAFGEVVTHGTPRRLALLVKDVADAAADYEEKGEGPAISSAFDAQGNPTKAAEGFAKKWGVSVADLARENGRLVANRKVAGQPARALLPDLLAKIVKDIPFKKPKMRWGTETETFPRPVRWLLALFGGEVVPVRFANVVAGGVSYGHRFLAPGALNIPAIADYLPRLRDAKVLASIAERRSRVISEIDRVALEAGGRRVEDPELFDTITGLVEWPSGVLGAFPEDALDMPREVLISEMRGHQKYASLETLDGKLMPLFVAVANVPVVDVAMSRRGYERVLRARLSDARYFFDEDRTKALAARLTDLRRVTFQEKLGSVHDKVDRIIGLARKVAMSIPYDDATAVERAATLCKADLTTGMVGEFPDLQGVMGREYAKASFERIDVADALFEHYLPRGASDALPKGDLGAIIGISDRLDTIAGIFAIGKAPSGANDPFALRRAALGILRVVLHKGYRLSLAGLLDHALEQHYARFSKIGLSSDSAGKDEKGKAKKPDLLARAEARAQVLEFFRARLKAMWSESHPADVVEAVLFAGFDDVTDAQARLIALARIRELPDFVPLAIAFSRASNIIEKQAKDLVRGEVDRALFQQDEEQALAKATAEARGDVARALRTGDYVGALGAIAALRPVVDAFFDKVLVMAPEANLKQNRLRLVADVQELFAPIADFGRIQTK